MIKEQKQGPFVIPEATSSSIQLLIIHKNQSSASGRYPSCLSFASFELCLWEVPGRNAFGGGIHNTSIDICLFEPPSARLSVSLKSAIQYFVSCFARGKTWYNARFSSMKYSVIQWLGSEKLSSQPTTWLKTDPSYVYRVGLSDLRNYRTGSYLHPTDFKRRDIKTPGWGDSNP